MILYVIGAILVILVVGWFSKADPPAKCGIYTQPNKWYPLKYYIFLLMLKLRQRKNAKMNTATGENAGYGVRSRSNVTDMEKAQTLPQDQPKAVDAVYFNGGNKDGQYMVAATARRQNNVVQTVLYLRLPGVGLLEIPSKPDTKLQGTDPEAFAAGGLTLEPVDPMKTWKISYKGKLRNHETLKELEVTFDLTWTAFTPYFDFDTDLHPNVMAESISKEKWSRKYFDVLQSVHQTHYEQFGEITGIVNIAGVGDKTIKVQGVRDHSYGNVRDWRYFHRYAITYATLVDKTAICIGCISMPITMTSLTIGYVIHPDGTKEPVSSSEFQLADHGEDGHPPKELSFKFTAEW
ncbi:hypothetical protein KP79_PYT06824 [Mizuhopecten yessoensis]|uniref:Uncharacterized protein n=1 Tax=Mizuhopecten yessoensis TaxID=6573 RepID=A0A210QUV2_MIZYE|nr:hypothetical protein KP79_PYT06824 [Mizuhopecten yessoensis]